MKTAVIGAGITGMMSAYHLNGYARTVIFEKENGPGGLCADIECRGRRIQKYNHLISASYSELFEVIGELGVVDNLFFRRAAQGVIVNGRPYALGRAPDLLRYPFLSFADKVRMAVFFLRNIWGIEAEKLFNVPARDWVRKQAGKKVLDHFFAPLLEFKFKDYSPISAAYLWARINENKNNRIGYLEGGLNAIFAALSRELRKREVEVKYNNPVRKISYSSGTWQVETADGPEEFDRVISTLPAATTLELCSPELKKEMGICLPSYLNVRSCLLRLKRPLPGKRWIYLIPGQEGMRVLINAAVLSGENFVYLPQYSPRPFPETADPGKLKQECLSLLRKVDPQAKEETIDDFLIFSAERVETIPDPQWLNYLYRRPLHFNGLYISELVYEPRLLKTLNTCMVKSRIIARDLISGGKTR